MDGQLYWATGKPGTDLDLAGLVCNSVNDPACINPAKGMEGGDTWENRLHFVEGRLRRYEIEHQIERQLSTSEALMEQVLEGEWDDEVNDWDAAA